mmetsp:Transcript_43097/g.111692  ORF Transcript_43097/g.111692 Transcript_43097/m.111692 type:complete len:231 (+) Transcript_43097:429-1121(+)
MSSLVDDRSSCIFRICSNDLSSACCTFSASSFVMVTRWWREVLKSSSLAEDMRASTGSEGIKWGWRRRRGERKDWSDDMLSFLSFSSSAGGGRGAFPFSPPILTSPDLLFLTSTFNASPTLVETGTVSGRGSDRTLDGVACPSLPPSSSPLVSSSSFVGDSVGFLPPPPPAAAAMAAFVSFAKSPDAPSLLSFPPILIFFDSLAILSLHPSVIDKSWSCTHHPVRVCACV